MQIRLSQARRLGLDTESVLELPPRLSNAVRLASKMVTISDTRATPAFHPMILDLMTTNGLLWESVFDLAKAIEKTADRPGLLMMKALIGEEVEQLAEPGCTHQSDRQVRHFARPLSFRAL